VTVAARMRLAPSLVGVLFIIPNAAPDLKPNPPSGRRSAVTARAFVTDVAPVRLAARGSRRTRSSLFD